MVTSGVTEGLSQGEDSAERGPLATARGPLANTQKMEKWWWTRMCVAILKPEITGDYWKNAKKQQPTENQKNTETEIQAKCRMGPSF